ncbi:S66 peptidase family protein [Romboutsia lituseburensis]|uniref:Muramoyltetrapeptide carboxypeptidase n=1 Tax=Romboutsia lituseburensis DSM 797 TaxID=1121325 RepID=A0A1G9L7E4_9FIRM|nr:LD-carboxypeptidase [Romboutsia lituseburensis]CEH35201.1 LD-carboxypeptidase [Romboutsia lituseburensis]SDL57890.1 muramoyltetrapeptide carboxypeptidase [Romboutsia lituseburensis DSM 797]
MNIPKPLKVGDTIGLIAPSGPLRKGNIEQIKSAIESYGYNVKIGESCYLQHKGYLAGDDETRAKDVEKMFLDNSIDAIMCLRGGYGTSRILDKIDYKVVHQNPKVFIGFSDITGLHIVFNQICNLSTYHGIMAYTAPKWDDFTYASFINAINFDQELTIHNPTKEKIYTIFEGKAEGKLTGGNLSLITSTLGTKYEINTKNKILFIEEIGEYIYRIDRMLMHLYHAGKLNDCSGIIYGDFNDCRKFNEDDNEIIDLLKEMSEKVNKPAIYNLQAGHCMPMLTLPLGANCYMDATNRSVKFMR